MNETFLALSMCLCIGLFWAILFLFRALESRIRQDLTGLRGKIGETDSRLLKIYLLTLKEKNPSLIENFFFYFWGKEECLGGGGGGSGSYSVWDDYLLFG